MAASTLSSRLTLLLSVLGSVAQGPGSGPPAPAPAPAPGGGSQNVHVSFGDVTDCTAPPTGTCADYTITGDQVLASLQGFTTSNGGSLSVNTFQYYGNWWSTNVGTSASVAADFCTTGDGAQQTSESETFSGVVFSQSSTDNTFTLEGYSVPNHDCENYCSAEGGETPPLMGTSFTTKLTQSFPMSLSTKSRADISNEVGWAVNGVTIFSPFTGAGTVAPYDETLDTCIGHPARELYHYHGFSPCLHGEDGVQSTAHSKIYGWSYDGFPIYGPHGYSDGNDAGSSVVRVTGGYKCTVDGNACSAEQKVTASNWAWSSDNGMLDDCNGRWTKTPEFPEGMYVYVLNTNADGTPDFPGVPYCTQSSSDLADNQADDIANTDFAVASVPTLLVVALAMQMMQVRAL